MQYGELALWGVEKSENLVKIFTSSCEWSFSMIPTSHRMSFALLVASSYQINTFILSQATSFSPVTMFRSCCLLRSIDSNNNFWTLIWFFIDEIATFLPVNLLCRFWIKCWEMTITNTVVTVMRKVHDGRVGISGFSSASDVLEFTEI